MKRCYACGRALVKYAVSIPTRDGERGWGPVCARSVVIRATRTRFPVVERRVVHKAVKRDARQIDWIEITNGSSAHPSGAVV